MKLFTLEAAYSLSLIDTVAVFNHNLSLMHSNTWHHWSICWPWVQNIMTSQESLGFSTETWGWWTCWFANKADRLCASDPLWFSMTSNRFRVLAQTAKTSHGEENGRITVRRHIAHSWDGNEEITDPPSCFPNPGGHCVWCQVGGFLHRTNHIHTYSEPNRECICSALHPTIQESTEHCAFNETNAKWNPPTP